MKTKSTAAVILAAVIFLFGLVFASPRAQAQGGVPLWTNRYSSANPKAVAVDSSGNVFVTTAAVGAGNGFDYATLKYSSTGVPLWTNRYDGPGNGSWNQPTSMAVDSSGNVVVTGRSDYIGHMALHTNWDYATIKYSNGGVPLWTNRYGATGNSYDEPTNITTDSSGNVVVTGFSGGNGTRFRYATIMYSSAGMPLWTNRYGTGDAFAAGVAVDATGNVFVTGGSGGLLGDGTSFDYATIKYSNAGVPLWTNRYNGPVHSQDAANGIAVDSTGDVVVTGQSDRVGNPEDRTYNDYLTIKYSNAGALLWVNRFNFPTYDNADAQRVAVAPNGNVFVTGFIEDTVVPESRAFAIVAYSSNGVLLWTNRFNGPGNERWSMAVDSSGNVFVTGSSYGTSNGFDFATIAYSGTGVPLWTNRYLAPGDIFGAASAVAVDGSGNVFVTGWSQRPQDQDAVTIKYSSISPPPVHLTIERDGSGGYFLRYTGVPDLSYRLQRAASVTGSWSNLATNTAPLSGLIEHHEVNPPQGAGFYRTLQP